MKKIFSSIVFCLIVINSKSQITQFEQVDSVFVESIKYYKELQQSNLPFEVKANLGIDNSEFLDIKSIVKYEKVTKRKKDVGYVISMGNMEMEIRVASNNFNSCYRIRSIKSKLGNGGCSEKLLAVPDGVITIDSTLAVLMGGIALHIPNDLIFQWISLKRREISIPSSPLQLQIGEHVFVGNGEHWRDILSPPTESLNVSQLIREVRIENRQNARVLQRQVFRQ